MVSELAHCKPAATKITAALTYYETNAETHSKNGFHFTYVCRTVWERDVTHKNSHGGFRIIYFFFINKFAIYFVRRSTLNENSFHFNPIMNSKCWKCAHNSTHVRIQWTSTESISYLRLKRFNGDWVQVIWCFTMRQTSI